MFGRVRCPEEWRGIQAQKKWEHRWEDSKCGLLPFIPDGNKEPRTLGRSADAWPSAQLSRWRPRLPVCAERAYVSPVSILAESFVLRLGTPPQGTGPRRMGRLATVVRDHSTIICFSKGLWKIFIVLFLLKNSIFISLNYTLKVWS